MYKKNKIFVRTIFLEWKKYELSYFFKDLNYQYNLINTYFINFPTRNTKFSEIF